MPRQNRKDKKELSHYTKSRLRAWFRPDKDVLCFPEWPQDVTASWGRFVMPDQ